MVFGPADHGCAKAFASPFGDYEAEMVIDAGAVKLTLPEDAIVGDHFA